MNINKRTKVALLFSVAIVGVSIIWFYTSAPTAAARFVWNKYHASSPALFLDRTDAKLAFNIGNGSFGMGGYNIPFAEKAFRKAVTIDPGLLYGHYQIARVLFVQGRLKEALVEINNELKYNPGNLRALYVRGLIRAYGKDSAGAEDDFQRFTQWAPSEWAGYNDLAWVLGQEGKYAEAEIVLERAFKNATGAATNPWLWDNLGVQQLDLKQYTDATISFGKAKALAATLTQKEWQSSYPGNDPAGSAGGIQAFQAAIEANIAQTHFKPL